MDVQFLTKPEKASIPPETPVFKALRQRLNHIKIEQDNQAPQEKGNDQFNPAWLKFIGNESVL